SARGRSRPGRTSDGCRSAGARRARGLVHRRGSSWLSFARPSHIPLNTAPAVPSKFRVEAIAANSTLTAIRGVRVGHAQDIGRRTGTTVVLLEPPAMAFADARGGWPGTYDTAASDLGKTFIERHALLLTGGDVYGFDAVRGIRRFLLEHKLASWSGGGKMPAIMGTNIYDLGFADVQGLDYTDLGYADCTAASAKPVAQGNVGAGIVGTDVPLEHEQLARLVELAHDGIALAVRPAHMSTDGDTILGFTTRTRKGSRLDYRAFDVLHHATVCEVARAVVNGVRAAKTLAGVPGFVNRCGRSPVSGPSCGIIHRGTKSMLYE